MKTKRILIKSKKDFEVELLSSARQLDQGKRVKKIRGEFFESLESVRNVLTEKRLELWRIIRDQKPHSILELSKAVKRDFKSVHGDLAILVSVGLVELKKEKGARGDVQRPVSLVDSLLLDVA